MTTVNKLTVVLANSYTLYLKTHNYHWNVTGPSFKSLHDLFEVQYTELATAVDDIAERIRALDAYAPGSFSEFLKLTTLNEAKAGITAEEMLEDMIDSQTALIVSLNDALSSAQDDEDEVTAGILGERLSVHEKARWMLKASK
ncbi:MAG: DNA protection during starvation protein 2 [Proteobacteria bacterium]|nr:MAG: DNA protection during starvation protein 2 [Pseudomonadota bacterium]